MICATTVAIAAPSMAYFPMAFIKIGSNAILINAPSAIIPIALFINEFLHWHLLNQENMEQEKFLPK